jgi:hypothetical protein
MKRVTGSRDEQNQLRMDLKYNAVPPAGRNRRSHFRVGDFLCNIQIPPCQASRFDMIRREQLGVPEDILWQHSGRGRIESQSEEFSDWRRSLTDTHAMPAGSHVG